VWIRDTIALGFFCWSGGKAIDHQEGDNQKLHLSFASVKLTIPASREENP
jgi:hypothetical protein